jgi:aminoglycoside phosphotransferase (APT) family kinase protein
VSAQVSVHETAQAQSAGVWNPPVSVLAGTGGVAPEELYARARERSSLAGFYNTNVALDTPAGRVVVRAPIHGADRMDLRIWPEAAVLRAIAAYVPDAPVVLHAESRFQIHEYVDGELLDEIAPRGTAVPGHVPDDVVALFAGLAAVPAGSLPEPPEGWPEDGDSASFARRLSAVTAGVHEEFGAEYAELFAALKVPADPLAPVLDAWASLTPRPFRLVHADVHRKNILIRAGRAVFLDWELALFGDPVYDLAVHLHKMGYLPEEERRTVTGWAQALPAELTAEWERDVPTYLRHERVKSTIVDSVRYAKLFTEGVLSPAQRPSYVQRLVTKVNLAREVWEIDGRVDEDGVARILERWAADHRAG